MYVLQLLGSLVGGITSGSGSIAQVTRLDGESAMWRYAAV